MQRTVVALAASIIVGLVATGAHAQLGVQKKLAQIDRSFVCPEDLPTEEARNDAVKLFLEQVAAVQPKITINEIVEYRMSLLKKHECRQTLANVGGKVAPSIAAPSTANSDHWENAGHGAGIAISVDMDSMVSAGPGRMRTWIKYHYDKPNKRGVSEQLIYELLDCSRNYHSTISLYSYSANGQIVDSNKGSADDEEPIIPESLLAGILPFTCAAHGLSVR